MRWSASKSAGSLRIFGLGRHTRPVARIAAAFGMLILAWDRDPVREYPDDEPVAERLPWTT